LAGHQRINLEKAKKLQILLSRKVIQEDRLPDPIRHVAGVDVAYTKSRSIGAVAVLDYNTLKRVEIKTAYVMTSVPYIPTYLSFREVSPVVSAIKKLATKPDVILADGHGLAHPRHLGFASHLGLALDKPTIGVAKSILCGEVAEASQNMWKPLVYKKEIVGAAVHTRANVKPVYVSVGHKITLESAIDIVLHCAPKYRIPEPIRQAHKAAQERKSFGET
jgi:deoxyribonuclease V